MKKFKNGFTLIELLATIAIIGVVTLIATITYNKVRNDILQREYKNLKALIETNGVKYSAKYGYTSFFVQELIDDNLIDPDDEKNIYDPRNDDVLNCHIVTVEIDKNGNYEATLGDQPYEGSKGCDISKVDVYSSKLTLTAKITQTTIDYLNPGGNAGSKITNAEANNAYANINTVNVQNIIWTAKNLDLTANVNFDSVSYNSTITGARYVWNKNTESTTVEPNRSYTTNFDQFFNDYFYLDMYTKAEEHYQARVAVHFDKEKPVIYSEKTKYADPADENVWKKSKDILIYATDKNGVGLDRVYAGTRPCSDLLKTFKRVVNGQTEYYQIGNAVTGGTVNVATVNDVEAGANGENGEINICAVDKLGNLADGGKFVIKKVDITPPQCDRVEGDHNEYQWEARTVKQYCYDNNVINGKQVTGSGCSQDPFPKTWNTTTVRDTITIQDNVGWTTNCTVDVYVDRTAPVCGTKSGEGSTSNWTQSTRTISVGCSDANVGCKQSSFSHTWNEPSGSVVRTSTIEIRDKVPRCSQASESGYCADYETIKNTSANIDDKNNTRNCDVNVYIDHKDPYGQLAKTSACAGNKIKSKCLDADSGIASDGQGGTTHTFAQGSHSVSITCKDKVGNQKTVSLSYTGVDCSGGSGGSGGCYTGTGTDGESCKVCFPTTCYTTATCAEGGWNYDEGTRCMPINTNYTNPSFGCAKFGTKTDNVTFTSSVLAYQSTTTTAKNKIYQKNCSSSGCSNSSDYYAYVNVEYDEDSGDYVGSKWKCTEFANYFGWHSGFFGNTDCLYWMCED